MSLVVTNHPNPQHRHDQAKVHGVPADVPRAHVQKQRDRQFAHTAGIRVLRCLRHVSVSKWCQNRLAWGMAPPLYRITPIGRIECRARRAHYPIFRGPAQSTHADLAIGLFAENPSSPRSSSASKADPCPPGPPFRLMRATSGFQHFFTAWPRISGAGATPPPLSSARSGLGGLQRDERHVLDAGGGAVPVRRLPRHSCRRLRLWARSGTRTPA